MIREATEADLHAILAIYNHAIVATTAVFSYAPHTLAMRAAWFAEKRAAGLPVFVAADPAAPDTVLGFATYGPFRAWPAYRYTVEHSVYVAGTARGRGIGRRLVADVVDHARSRDMHAVIAGIEAENVPSLRLHAALGFAEVAHFREVGYKFGRWLDLKFLELVLDTPAAPSDGVTAGA